MPGGSKPAISDVLERPLPAASVNALLEALPVAALAIAADGRVRIANRCASELLGYALEELVGKADEALVAPRLAARVLEWRDTFFAQPFVLSFGDERDFALLTRDGRELPVEIGFGALSSSAGLLALWLLGDLSLARKSEEKFAKMVSASPLAI